ncbi:hypothetical protein KAFR_0D00140 [Kazachstania africana CBS 2517]|uniref:DNA replication checkpoint mediator MRC1 domain-containing protein n=1 Tax=Kazachstania africana (strain ATCC 22294 / BCRC 22015 / CBS 2517 / CECT 1963 / NBRC 1671 / NRRL Y-8276) TaxID=1071382 RepID=H2ATG0_KAZAF|nr:hypothetical protein KAFR_0D00140 [Kazachstania africana CBS 2517]CCF57660.1 hypothetical protein KAFR_0D00140 [Kazachstania africana CBS 2517]
MDGIFGNLQALKPKKRTTYKKISDDLENDTSESNNDPPALTGEGFLFDNPTLNRIKKRLDGEEKDVVQYTMNFSQTQLISNLYGGGEDLDAPEVERREKQQLHEQQLELTKKRASKGQLHAFTKSSGNINDLRLMQPTQVIGSTQLAKEFSPVSRTYFKYVPDVNQSTQVIHSATQDDTQVVSAREADTQATQMTQVLSASTQGIYNTQETQSITDSTQPISYSSSTQDYKTNKFNRHPTPEDTQIIPREFDDDASTLPIPEGDKTQKDTSAVLKTQIDSTTEGTSYSATVSDTLKIHEIQRELEESQKTKTIPEYKQHVRTPKNVIVFTKESYFDEFDSDDEEKEENLESEGDSQKVQLLKNTSPSDKSNDGKRLPDKTRTSPSFKPKLHGLNNYELKLKRQLNSDQQIDLNLDSDDEDGIDRMGEKGPISQMSKATVFDIKARLSKKRPIVKISNDSKTTLHTLFNKLQKASRQQIIEHQKEVIEKKGLNLEDIEKEKKIVENLLEQEINRNKKIRQREKEREKQLADAQDDENDLDFDHSANELDESELSGEESAIDSDNDYDDFSLEKTKRSKKKVIVEDSDTEIEDEKMSHNAQIREEKDDSLFQNRNAINLGPYGDNLSLAPIRITTEKQSGKNFKVSRESGDERDEEIPEKDRIRLIEEKKQHELERQRKQMKKRKEMKAKGITNFLEEEAEESEDEWHGIGGIDGEMSDEYDSEVEKMIDDYSKANFNPDEIRQMLADENKETDIKMVEKILYDIKNGGFRKRRKGAMDLELSDEEDDELKQYRLKRRELMRQKRLEVGEAETLVKNPKSKAFFESMVDDIVEVKNPFAVFEPQRSGTITTDDGTQENANSNEGAASQNPSKKVMLSEEFVQRTLSFLNSSKDMDQFAPARSMRAEANDELIEDLTALKKQSSIKSFKTTRASVSQEPTDFDKENDDSFDDLLNSRVGTSSIMKTFSATVDINDKFQEGVKTVKVSKAYKSVSSSKASITYMGKMRKLVAPQKKVANLSSSDIKNTNSRTSKLFSRQDESFES